MSKYWVHALKNVLLEEVEIEANSEEEAKAIYVYMCQKGDVGVDDTQMNLLETGDCNVYTLANKGGES